MVNIQCSNGTEIESKNFLWVEFHKNDTIFLTHIKNKFAYDMMVMDFIQHTASYTCMKRYKT